MLPTGKRGRGWPIMIATALVAGSIGLAIGALGPTLPSLHLHLHTPLDHLGVLFGADFAGSLVATLVAGPLLDRYPARPLLAGGAGTIALGLLILPLASSLPLALAGMMLVGVGAGVTSVGSTVLANRLFGADGGRALAIVNMTFGLGAFIGPLIAAAVLDAIHDYRPVFVAIAVSVVPPLVVFARLSAPSPRLHHSPALRRIPRAAYLSVFLLSTLDLYLRPPDHQCLSHRRVLGPGLLLARAQRRQPGRGRASASCAG